MSKWLVVFALLVLISGCGKPLVYAVDFASGERRCVTATSIYNYNNGSYALYLNGQTVAVFSGVVAIQVVDSCKEVRR